MGCQSSVVLENNLTFSVMTHDPDTGILTDADAVPAYRIYEDETATPILNGNMAKLDDVNTTGFYTEQIACTAVNGFEAGKSYTIYIVATVDSDTGGISYGFTVTAATVAVGAGGIPVGGFSANSITAGAFAADAGTEIGAAVVATQVEAQGTYTLQQALSIILAASAGVTADAGATLKTADGVATRIAATINGSNERTAITLTPSA